MDMKSRFLKVVISLSMALATFSLRAADPQIILQTNPDGAEVYLNGQLICTSTPAIVPVSSKNAGKTMLFQFVKNGYESKSLTLTFNKKELKAQPIVRCTLTRKPTQADITEQNDPGIRRGHGGDRVSRDHAGKSDMERTIIRWFFDSDPRGARIFWRVISSVPAEVKNTNETYLTTTPYEETRGFNIQGLTYDNSRDVTIEVKVSKRGYEDQVKRFNVRQCLDQQEISGFYELVPKDEPVASQSRTKKKKKTVTTYEEEEESGEEN